MKRGIFITLEGIEGVGKSTHIEYIASLLKNKGHDSITTREPGGTPLGEAVRDILLHGKELSISPQTELMLMFSARCQHLQQVILPTLTQGRCVICDRFTDASYAYQGAGRGIPESEIEILESWVQGDLRPDLTLLFDASVKTGLRRAGERSDADRFESEQPGFFNRVRQAYLDRARREPHRIKVIDAEASITDVEKQLNASLISIL